MRVHKIIRCKDYESNYDEVKGNGYAVEQAFFSYLREYGFVHNVEITVNDVVGHIDFLRDRETYIEIIELKNTDTINYLHVLQLSLYKALVLAYYKKPVLGYLVYATAKTVVGDNPLRPNWIPDYFNYVALKIDSSMYYLGWAQFKAEYRNVVAGPYCIYCSKQCSIKHAVRERGEKFINSQILNNHEQKI